MTSLRRLALVPLLLSACSYPERESPTIETGEQRPGGGGGGVDGDCSQAEVCSGGEDEDCDGAYDCSDSDCFGVGECPSCGELDLVEGQPLALPDGDGNSYETSIVITGFTDGQTSTAVTDFLGVCVNMEHSWLRDLEIELTCPSGQTIVLQQFLGQEGGLLQMGQPDDLDYIDPVPGVGAEYCWTPTATNPPMLEWGNAHPGQSALPAGDYQASEPFTNLVGCTLNGPWRIRVTDLWSIDNGFIFSWGVAFEPDIVEDCDGWVE